MQCIINSTQAAKIIGCSAQRVRERIKRGVWTFGSVVTPKQAGRGIQNCYEINVQKLANYLCISVEELERRLADEEK